MAATATIEPSKPGSRQRGIALAENTAPPGCGWGPPYRNIRFANGLVTDLMGVTTIPDAFSQTVSKNGDRPCMGVRSVELVEQVFNEAAQKEFEKVTQGPYSFVNYDTIGERVVNFGAGLVKLGQTPGNNIAIYAETRPDWMVAAQASFANSFPVATVYANLGSEAITHALNETEVTHVVTDSGLLKTLGECMDDLPLLQCVVYFGEQASEEVLKKFEKVGIHTFAAVEQLGKENPAEQIRPKAEDTAVIMYTSGSTGLPKGVMMSHSNIVSCVSGVSQIINPALTPEDRYIAYLPLAHVMELVAEITMLSHGCCIGYGHPSTLSGKSARTKEGTEGDVTALKPTLMAAVPLIMDRIRKGVTAQVEGASKLKRKMFHMAYDKKTKQLEETGTTNTKKYDKIVFKKIKESLGGELRLMLSGGAPLSPATQRFMNVCFGVPIAQGYGLTETCGAGCVTAPDDIQVGTVGAPLPCCQIKLVDWEEGGYLTADKDNKEIGVPRGEIAIHGTNVTKGYYKNEEKTAEAYRIDADGLRWFYTGDIGQWQPDGTLKIIDRKKDLVKLQQGEYVSLGKVEAVLKESHYVENVCVYANSDHTYAVALICPVAAALLAWASADAKGEKAKAEPKKDPEDHEDAIDGVEVNAGPGRLDRAQSIQGSPFATLCANPDAIAEVQKSIKEIAKNAGLKGFEVPKKIKLCWDEWTPDNNLVTAALKLKRKNITDHYKDDLEILYRD